MLNGAAPYPYRGYCATFDGMNTYYGLYGLGFPTEIGWGICSALPASGGDYPEPAYDYAPVGPPAGVRTLHLAALGYALSDVGWRGWIRNGRPGHFSAEQLGAAVKLVYDNEAWGIVYPVTDAGTTEAIELLRSITSHVAGITAAPTIGLTLRRGTTLKRTGVLVVKIRVPGARRALSDTLVAVQLRGATVTGTSATSGVIRSGARGTASMSITVTGLDRASVTARASATLGVPGMTFWAPREGRLSAQVIAAPRIAERAYAAHSFRTSAEVAPPTKRPGSRGPTGATGQAGRTGQVGQTGLSGAVGAAGPQGPIGPTGAKGPGGAAGTLGRPGPTGASGSSGAPGSIGPSGRIGGTGARGLTGTRGSTGLEGPIGQMGTKGSTGPTGPRGAPGQAGAEGLTGLTGPRGSSGAKGELGATGPEGPKGPSGASGSVGPTGPGGALGPAGALGPRGSTGEDGQLGATGPAGAVGSPGPAGPLGPRGATGAKGAIGPMGPTGALGPSGPMGSPGPKGDTGATGRVGATGSRGGIAAFAYVYNESAEVVPISSAVTFDGNGPLLGVTHAPGSSSIVVTSGGTYLVDFSTSGVEPSQFTLFVDGTAVPGTTYGSGAGTQQNAGQAIVTLSAGDSLSLVNDASSAAVGLQSLAGGTQANVDASIVIQQIG